MRSALYCRSMHSCTIRHTRSTALSRPLASPMIMGQLFHKRLLQERAVKELELSVKERLAGHRVRIAQCNDIQREAPRIMLKPPLDHLRMPDFRIEIQITVKL